MGDSPLRVPVASAAALVASATDSGLEEVVPHAVQPAPLTGFRLLPAAGQFYVGAVVLVGAVTFAAYVPRSTSDPGLFIALAIWTCITSLWKVALPVGKSRDRPFPCPTPRIS